MPLGHADRPGLVAVAEVDRAEHGAAAGFQGRQHHLAEQLLEGLGTFPFRLVGAGQVVAADDLGLEVLGILPKGRRHLRHLRLHADQAHQDGHFGGLTFSREGRTTLRGGSVRGILNRLGRVNRPKHQPTRNPGIANQALKGGSMSERRSKEDTRKNSREDSTHHFTRDYPITHPDCKHSAGHHAYCTRRVRPLASLPAFRSQQNAAHDDSDQADKDGP